MDHLLLPQNPLRTLPIEVPCLSLNRYDGQGFQTYPERQNWGPRPIQEWNSLFNKPTKEFCAFLQTWLFFGIMEVLLCEPIDPNDFVRNVENPPRQVITTVQLLPKLERWILTIGNRLPPETIYRIMADLSLTYKLNIMLRCSRRIPKVQSPETRRSCGLIQYILSGVARECRDPRLAMSSAILTETLLNTMYYRDMPDSRGHLGTRASTLLNVDEGDPISREMRLQGWCPADLSMMHRRFNSAGLYYIGHVERPEKTKLHPMIRIRPMDSLALNDDDANYPTSKLCTRSRCSQRNLDQNNYSTKHVDNCSGCFDVVADYDRISHILHNGAIPLILSIDPEDDSTEITLVESEPDHSYVAISHVWSDGLGNLDRSALPHCQMRRLSRLVRSLPGKAANLVLFWMDTICCPPDSAGKDGIQSLAIAKMRETYEEAKVVLVLDSWLQQYEIKQAPHVDILMRIIASGWNSRLWTLQEGALADMLLFQFSDAAYDVDEGVDLLAQTEDVQLDISIKSMIIQRIHEFRGFRKIENNLQVKLLALVNALSFRSTSVATDEPLCLSALLGLNTMKIINAPAEDRMRAFWNQFDSVPYSLLLSPFPRLRDNGYGWAPQTFLSTKHALSNLGTSPMVTPMDSWLLASVHSRGLSIQSTGIIFSTEKCFIGEFLYIRVDDKWYFFHVNLIEADGTRQDHDLSHDPERPGRMLNPWDRYGTEKVAFIPTKYPEDWKKMLQKTGFSDLDDSGIFVAIEREEANVIYARRMCHGSCTKNVVAFSSIDEIYCRPQFLPVYNCLYGQAGVVSGELRSPTQRWCIA